MNGINLLWLVVGVGIGVAVSWTFRLQKMGKQAPANAAKLTNIDDQDNRQELLEMLRQTDLAYHMATQMSQFKGSFLARTAHELRSPLNGLIGMHQLILSDLCDGPQEEREFIAHAHTCALKMIEVLSDVTEAAKVEHGTSRVELQPIQLAELLQNVHTLTHLQARDRNFQLTISYPDPQLYVLSDPRRLQQILVSLISTTLLHMTEGSIILSVQSAAKNTAVHVWIDQPLTLETWNECVTDPNPDRLIASHCVSGALPADDDVEAIRAIAQRSAAVFPSPGFTFLIAQRLLASMKGNLEIVPLPLPSNSSTSDTQTPFTQLQCTLPLTSLES